MTNSMLTAKASNKAKNHINREYWKYKASPIIRGYFPQYKTYEELAISKVNKSLCVILAAFVVFSLVSYYFVTYNEMTLNKIRKETIALNDENAELQNQLDSKKSYNNVDKTMQSNNLLKKATDVIEVQATGADQSNITVRLINNEESLNRPFGY